MWGVGYRVLCCKLTWGPPVKVCECQAKGSGLSGGLWGTMEVWIRS